MPGAEANQAVRAGAKCIVSPVFEPAVVASTNQIGAVSVPGVYTPSEMAAADRWLPARWRSNATAQVKSSISALSRGLDRESPLDHF